MGKHGNCLQSILNSSNCPDPIQINCDDDFSDFDLESCIDQFEAPPSEAGFPEQVLNENDFPNLLYYFKKFLEYTENLFDYVSPHLITQSNESLNYIKTKFADKNTKWNTSFELRMALSVLHKNKPYLYYIELLEKMVLPKLSDKSLNVLERYSKISVQTRAKLHDPEFVSKRNKTRFNLRNKKYSSSPNDHITHLKEIKINEEQINITLKSFRPISNEIQKRINKKNELSSQRKRKSKTKITPSDNIRNEEIRNLDELSDTNEQIYSDESSDYDKSEFDSSDDESTDYTDSEYDDEYIYSSCSPIYPKPNPEINSGLIN